MLKSKLKREARVTKYYLYKETLINKKEHFWSFLGAFIGIFLIAMMQEKMLFSKIENVFLIGSFGASCVLIYGAIQSPLAQPRNLIGGHVISAVIGVTIAKFVPDITWLQAPLAVGLSIVFMQITKTLHPPGGATALIAVTGGEKIAALGYYYVLSPVLSGCLILLIVALIFNNITKERSYPTSSKYTKIILRKLRSKKE